MEFKDMIRMYSGKDIKEVSKKELEQIEAKLKKTSHCKKCGFQYQYNDDISHLKDLPPLNEFNTVFIEVFCEDHYAITDKGFKCDFETRTNSMFDLKKCPKCDGGLIFTALALKVDASGLVESFCPKCKGMISSGRPFERV
jgi:predicted Zn-ribbon and HTH transcriptional regulator